MYVRTALACLLAVTFHCHAPAQAPSKAAVKKLAQQMGKSTMAGDYAMVIDHTYDPVVKLLGGRDKAIETTKKIMDTMKAQGFVIKSYVVGEPGPFHSSGGNTFVVLPVKMEMNAPNGKILAKSYTLGISTDQGKTWKFVEGAGLKNEEMRRKVLPKLPAKLKLPEYEKPMLIKE